jgi:flagellar hook protein FlgE
VVERAEARERVRRCDVLGDLCAALSLWLERWGIKMASTTALFTAMTGLNANARQIEVVGNNVANTNTTAFKSSRLSFSTMFSRTINAGTAPADTTGGTNPYQIGLGVQTAGTQLNTQQGTISPTGDSRDLAVDGRGFFVVARGEDRLFTRAGAFRQNAEGVLTTISGERVQGYGVDENFSITTGTLTDISIPIGQLAIAEATTEVRLRGNLNAEGALPTQGSLIRLGTSTTQGLIAIPSAAPAAPNVIDTTTRLIDIEDPARPGSGASMLSAGQSIRLRGAEKGTAVLPQATLGVDGSTTIADLTRFLSEAMGINTDVGVNPDGRTPGVSIDPATGLISIVGNTGTVNDLTLESTSLQLLDSAGTVVGSPFVPTQLESADGESISTDFTAFDSLGSQVGVRVSMVLDSRSANGGTTWRYFVESPDNAGVPTQVGTGTVSFDSFGQPLSTEPVSITIDRTGTGAITPMVFSLSFATPSGGMTAYSDLEPAMAVGYRDGVPFGTLSSFSIGTDGIITGTFSNSQSRPLGQIVLATVPNPEGLQEVGSNLWQVALNSGPAAIGAPGTLGSGRISSGALELSNVDLGEEFIRLVLSSTGYSANSRVIRTTDELMQQLLVLGR